jgi:hypothetical protein
MQVGCRVWLTGWTIHICFCFCLDHATVVRVMWGVSVIGPPSEVAWQQTDAEGMWFPPLWALAPFGALMRQGEGNWWAGGQVGDVSSLMVLDARRVEWSSPWCRSRWYSPSAGSATRRCTWWTSWGRMGLCTTRLASGATTATGRSRSFTVHGLVHFWNAGMCVSLITSSFGEIWLSRSGSGVCSEFVGSWCCGDGVGMPLFLSFLRPNWHLGVHRNILQRWVMKFSKRWPTLWFNSRLPLLLCTVGELCVVGRNPLLQTPFRPAV